MNSSNNKLQKVSRIVLILVRIVQGILLYSIVLNAYTGMRAIGISITAEMGDSVTSAIQNISISTIALAVLFIASAFLKSIRSEYTPFIDKNVARLKSMAILIAIIEPIGLAINFFSNMLRPISADGIKTVTHSSMGGMVIVLGLIVYCIAIVFEHGSYLQKQSDETL